MRALTIIDEILLVFFYIHSFEMLALVYDKFLRVFTASDWSNLIMNMRIG